jgi:rhamnulose-1-phosphate aldolase
MWQKGWAEANAGNISLRLEKDQAAGLAPKSDWVTLSDPLPELAREAFLVTGTGRYLRNISLFPWKNVGIIELDETASRYRVLEGFEPTGGPTSELVPHLMTHAAIKTAFNDRKRAVIHTHAPNLIALTYALDLDSATLSKLLWQCHVECIIGFPAGIEFIPWMMAGSKAIAEATAMALRKRPLAVWQFHGVFGTGRNLDEAFGMIDMAEKAAGIYLAAKAAGGVRNAPTVDQLRAIAANFKSVPEEGFLAADTGKFFK